MPRFFRSRFLLGSSLLCGGIGLTLISELPLVHGQIVKTVVKEEVKVEPGKKEANKKDDRDWNEPITLPIQEDARNKIEAVNKYLTGKEPITPKLWGDIIGVLQAMLNEPTDRFVEVKDSDGKTTKVSVKREVNRILGTFNDDGRQFYQQMLGPEAEQKLKLAEETNDMQLMAEVSQAYLHTKAGAAATVRLGSWHLDRGRYIQAALTFRNLLARNAKEELPADLLFKAAVAFKRQGTDPEFSKASQTYWDRFEKASNKGNVTIGTKSLTFEQLKAEYDKAAPASVALFTNEWGLARGGPSNNAIGSGGTPFLEPLFSYSYLAPSSATNPLKVGFDQIKDQIDKSLKLLDNRGLAILPGNYPLAANGKLLFRGHDGLYCMALREDKSVDPPIKPGEMLWKSPDMVNLIQMLMNAKMRPKTEGWIASYLSNGPFSILVENPLIGSISHDGTNVYVIDEVAVPPHPTQWQINMNLGTGQMGPSFGELTHWVYCNKLKAVNIETGKVTWSIQGLHQETTVPQNTGRFPGVANPPKTEQPVAPPPGKETLASILSDAIFLGPPLPLAGKLYVVIEKDGDLRLLCLDPTRLEVVPELEKTYPAPALVWSQVLGQPNGKLPNDSIRRYQGINLAYADGMLIVPTNAGAVLGIDLFSHSLVWAANYRSDKQLQQRPMDLEGGVRIRGGGFIQQGMANQPTFDTTKERWHASAPVISNGKVVYTAFDSTTVECVDLHDGRPAWRNPIMKQEGDLYLAGVFDDKVMIVGKGYVRFHSLATGQQLKEPIPTGIPTGIGTATKNVYYLPVAASKEKSNDPGIIAIDYRTMMIKGTSRSRKKEQAGNLLFYDGDVYSLTPFSLSAYPQLDATIKKTQERLAKNSLDPIGLLDLAMLEQDDGRLVSAIENYQKALANNPPEETRFKGREKLFEAITELLQTDFNSGEKLLAEYRKLCEVEIPASSTEQQRKLLAEEELRRKSNYFCLVAKGKESQGKLLEAFENYMSFGTLIGNREMISVIDEPNTNARPDVWARGRIQHMIKNATPEQRKPLENKVNEEWKKIREQNNLDQLRGFVRVFGGMFDAGLEARITLATRLSTTGNEEDMREAEYMLLSIRDGEDRIAAAKSVEALARLFIRKGLLDDAVGMYNELGSTYAKDQIIDGKTGAELYSELITDKRFLPYLDTPKLVWTHGPVRGAEMGGSGGFSAIPVDLEGDLLPYFKRYRLTLTNSARGGGGYGLRVVDPISGEEKFASKGLGTSNNYQYVMMQNNIPLRMVQVKGHVAVVTVHGNNNQTGMPTAKVFAFDVADQKQLWEIDLNGTNPNPNVQNMNIIAQLAEPDGLRLTFPDGWSTKVGQTWAVESTFAVVLTRDGLVAKDHARGTVLWTKSNVSPRTNLFSDNDHVYVYECAPDGGVSSVRCYRAADGVEMPIPDSSHAFTSLKKSRILGNKVLSETEADGKKTLRFYDFLTGKDLWKKEFGKGWSIIKSRNPEFTGYVTAEGAVHVLNVLDGKQVFQNKLDPTEMTAQLDKVNEVFLFNDQERFFVMLNKPLEGPANRNVYQHVFYQGIRSSQINGVLYAFDRAANKRLWHTTWQLEDMNIALEYFDELPILIAADAYQKFGVNGNFEGQFVKFLALDKATGKLAYYKEAPINNTFTGILMDNQAGFIDVMSGSGQKIRFTSVKNPIPQAAIEKVDPKKPVAPGIRNVRPIPVPAIAPPPVPLPK